MNSRTEDVATIIAYELGDDPEDPKVLRAAERVSREVELIFPQSLMNDMLDMAEQMSKVVRKESTDMDVEGWLTTLSRAIISIAGSEGALA